MSKAPRLKTCKNKECKKKFIPERQMQTTCHYSCALAYASQLKEKRAKNEQKRINKDIKDFKATDMSNLKKIAQKVFNEFIRLRDYKLPCISCSKIFTVGETTHASHYRPATNTKLRYDERNVYRSCVKCNVFLSSNAIKYREALVQKYGEEFVSELDNTNGIYKFTVEELQEIITKYRLKVKVKKIELGIE